MVDWCDNMHSLLHIGRMYNSEVKKVFSAVHIYVHVYPKLLRFLRDRNIPLLYAPVTLNYYTTGTRQNNTSQLTCSSSAGNLSSYVSENGGNRRVCCGSIDHVRLRRTAILQDGDTLAVRLSLTCGAQS